MRELNDIELAEVNGAVLPLAYLAAVSVGKALSAGFATGFAVGAIIAIVD